jgi:ribosomal-protein-alanine N-acetyltransferase
MEPDSVTITGMELEHIDQVITIERASFGEPWSPRQFAEELTRPQALNLVALRRVAGDAVTGYACAWVLAGECSLHKLACLPALRRTGIATLLLGECIRRAQCRGAAQVVLEVRERNTAARALYAGLGFAPVGRRKGYYSDTREDALIMARRCDAADQEGRRRHG